MATGKEIGGEGGSFAAPNVGLAQSQMSTENSVTKYLIKKGNKSGTHKPAPHMIHNLINNLNGLPFKDLFQKGAAVLNLLGPLMQGIAQASKMLGGSHNVGNFSGALMKQIGQQAGVSGDFSNLTNTHIAILQSAPNAEDIRQQLVDAVGGPGIAAGLSLMAFGDQSNILNIVNGTGGIAESWDNVDPSLVPAAPPLPPGADTTASEEDKSHFAVIGMLDNLDMSLPPADEDA